MINVLENGKTKIKNFLSKNLNKKLQILVFLLLFTIFNRIIGYFNSTEFGMNLLMIMIMFAIISFVDGVWKYGDK